MTTGRLRLGHLRNRGVVVGAWALATLASLWVGGDLSNILVDEDRSFLPAGSNSAAFLADHEQRRRGQPPRETATVVAAASTTLGSQALRSLESLSGTLSTDPDLRVAETGGIVVSPDGQVALFDLELEVDDDDVEEAVSHLRNACAAWSSSEEAVQCFVTGEAAVEADLGAEDVDLWLLLCSAVLVAVVLAAVYRSPVLWMLPVGAGLVAVVASRAVMFVLAQLSVPITELTASIGAVVVFGVCTDYALLLLQRVRHSGIEDRDERLADAVKHVRTPVVVSAVTIVLTVLALTPSSVPAISGLGPALAGGVVCAAAVTLTLLPALLGLLRVPVRRAMARRGFWTRFADAVVFRPLRAAACSAVILVALSCLVVGWKSSADPLANIPNQAESKRGAQVVRDHFGSGITAPLLVSFSDEAPADAVQTLEVQAAQEGVGVRIVENEDLDGRVVATLALEEPAFTSSWVADMRTLGAIAQDIDEDALVGGPSAEAMDREDAVRSQLVTLAPTLLVALLVALALWLGSVVAAVVMVLSACLSAAAATGATAVAMPLLTDSVQSSAEVLLFGLLFLLAFGIDYVVFLADGIRQSTPGSPHSRRVAEGLSATGPVITSASLVLASTFAVLLFVPEANVRQVGLLVAIGVLVDALLVRTLLVPPMLSWVGDRWARPDAAIRIRRIGHRDMGGELRSRTAGDGPAPRHLL